MYQGKPDFYELCSKMIGAFWFTTDYHGGQWSDLYRLHCAIPFSPGMSSGPEEGTEEEQYYEELEGMSESERVSSIEETIGLYNLASEEERKAGR